MSVPHGDRPLPDQIRFRLFQARMWREYAMMHDGWAPSYWVGGHRLRTGGWPTPQSWVTTFMPESTRARCLRQSRINVKLAQRLRRRLANV